MTQTALFESEERTLIARLRAIAGERGREAEAGALLIDLRALSDGRFHLALAQIRPELKRPDAWADRVIKLCRQGTPALHQEHAPPSPAAKARADSSRRGPAPQGRTTGRSAETSVPRALDERSHALFEALRPLLALDGAERLRRIDELAEEMGSSRRTIYRQLKAIRQDGSRALVRRQRRDAGEIQVPEEVRNAFIQRRLDPMFRHERVSVSIRRVGQQFPGVEISTHSLRRIARSLPAALQMRTDDWRQRFLPGPPVELPYANHTHAFDFTIGDVFVWDGDPEERPYRPWLVGIVDEHTQSCMFGLYGKGAPNRAALQACLLHAWLPKADPRWTQCGAPEHIHCDNGKVQASDWLADVCRTLKVDLPGLTEDIRHTHTYSGWEQGHVERFFGIVHEHYETMFGPAYCGPGPDRKPECFVDPSGGVKVWRTYPMLADLNSGFHGWVAAEYHNLRHSRLKMSRLDAWQLHARGHVTVPDRDYLYTVLLQRAGKRQVARGRVRVNTFLYEAPILQGYEGTPLEVRWDPADLTRVLLFGYDGQAIGWAERERPMHIDQPEDLAAHNARRREKRQTRQLLAEATGVIATTDEGAFREHVEELREARKQAGIVPFPIERSTRKPRPPEELTADEILSALPEVQPDPEKLTIYGLEI